MLEPGRTCDGLEVVCLSQPDVEAAELGGADRIHLAAMVDGEARSVEPALVSAVVRSTDLPVRVTLRLSAGLTTQGGELSRLIGLAADYLTLGVEGFVLGFLTAELDVDAGVCNALIGELGDVPWTFDRSFDRALDARHAWRALRSLPGCDSVHTAGALLGPARGIDDLIAQARTDPTFAAAAVLAGEIRAEDVPWAARVGVTRLHLEELARPGGSWTKAHVDPSFVRSWRLLLDRELEA